MLRSLCSAASSLVMFVSLVTAHASATDLEPSGEFLKLPAEYKLGACSAVAVNRFGEIYLFHRGPHPIICVDAHGKLLRSWGDDIISSAHGLRIDREDNVWVTDIGNHRVFKFDRRGKLLLTLGTGQPGDRPDQFNKPTDIAFGPSGEFYVTDGYGNARVMKFSPSGALIHSWGKPGKERGEFRIPHSIVVDAQGRLLVGDRENDRIQIFSPDGELLDVWNGYAPYGLAFNGAGQLFVADGRANQVLQLDAQGKVVRRLGREGSATGEFRLPHMLAFDAYENLYVAEIGGQRLQTFQSPDRPVNLAPYGTGGHVHPSICRTKAGTLIVVYKNANVLWATRSTDDGRTWSQPGEIATSAKRPDVIREVKIFEVYPGTVDALSDDRVLVTWNYIADDKKTDGYYERALLFTLSTDQGLTWSEQQLIGPVEGHHLGAVRHNVLPWSDGRWLLPLRVGPPRLFDPRTRELTVFNSAVAGSKQHAFQQIVRTAKGTLLAMGPEMLRSTDDGRTWHLVSGFRSVPDTDTAEGRHLTVLSDGGVLVTYGVGTKNVGLHYNYSADDGVTWNNDRTVSVLPSLPITARYYSARTVQVDRDTVGTVYMNGSGVHFLRVAIDRLKK